jgi:Family of unknown function (DUF6510)
VSSAIGLDGNAAAGPLGEFFRPEMTAAMGKCASCGRRAALADVRVFGGDVGLVLRCVACDAVLVRVVTSDRRSWLDLSGLAVLEFERPE